MILDFTKLNNRAFQMANPYVVTLCNDYVLSVHFYRSLNKIQHGCDTPAVGKCLIFLFYLYFSNMKNFLVKQRVP